VPWRLTPDPEEYGARVWDLLAAEPAEHTVALTVIESLRAGQRWSDAPMTFGWLEGEAGEVRGAVSLTPPFELLLAAVPADSTEDLVAALRAEGAAVPGVNGPEAAVERFAAAWTAGTPLPVRTVWRQRLYRLGTLEHPSPLPPGRARRATEADLALGVRWYEAFQDEVKTSGGGLEAMVRERIEAGRLWLWDDESGVPVSLAGRTAAAAGVSRVAPVYTPPEARRRGYGAAVTAAVTADALERDADEVVLFTDLANPTSNAIYQGIGFRPLSDRHVVQFSQG
jgi:predicted GNAT family acetyltransferase